ncbi:unnamed protein product [Schistosoma margrebowiei]|uniref:Uncharacterized protein n=1 Tax=Schistosoma margrebowiei TaxID=48269 RepID=A0AA84Z5A1_9TREM|nr:unnamed protein product [Schistosoma margrebowiei]
MGLRFKQISLYDVEKAKSSEDEVVKKYYECMLLYNILRNIKDYEVAYVVFKEAIVEKWEARKRLDEDEADPLRKDELRQKFRHSSMVYGEITSTLAEKIEEIETLRFRLLEFLPSHKRTQTVLDAMKRFAIL